MSLTETEKYMLAGAGGLVAERLADHYARKALSMPIWAFTAVTLGIYFGTHAIGTAVSHYIDPQHGQRRFRDTSNEIYQQMNLARQISDPIASSTDRTILLTKGITVGQQLVKHSGAGRSPTPGPGNYRPYSGRGMRI